MIQKPYHRIHRRVKNDPNKNYSSLAYIRDRNYTPNPLHYIRAFNLILADLQKLFEFVEPSEASLKTYSYRIHELLMRTCIEIEANLKAILKENVFKPAQDRYGRDIYNIHVYKKINVSHHLSAYKVTLPVWNGNTKIWVPFKAWDLGESLEWYQSYNESKHDRQEAFQKANLETLINAIAGLLVVLSSQFADEDFSAGSVGIEACRNDYHEFEPSIGSMFRIKYPDNWKEHEYYNFDWAQLKNEPDRFQKYNYGRG